MGALNRKNAFCGLLLCSLVAAIPAPADALVTTDQTAESAQEQASGEAVLVIRFNQKNVYFRNPLKRVIGSVSQNKPDAVYELQSTIPQGGKVSINGKEYGENLQNVINVMGILGVDAGKIKVTTIVSDKVDNQEISVFVK